MHKRRWSGFKVFTTTNALTVWCLNRFCNRSLPVHTCDSNSKTHFARARFAQSSNNRLGRNNKKMCDSIKTAIQTLSYQMSTWSMLSVRLLSANSSFFCRALQTDLFYSNNTICTGGKMYTIKIHAQFKLYRGREKKIIYIRTAHKNDEIYQKLKLSMRVKEISYLQWFRSFEVKPNEMK